MLAIYCVSLFKRRKVENTALQRRGGRLLSKEEERSHAYNSVSLIKENEKREQRSQMEGGQAAPVEDEGPVY